MAVEIKLPRLGQGMEAGTIVRWLKSEGDAVAKGEPLYELDTDKVTQEVEADAEGVLLKIVVPDGEVEVGRTVAVIGAEGEDVAALGDGDGSAPAPPAAAEPAPAAPAAAEPGPVEAEGGEAVEAEAVAAAPATAPGERVKASPLARRIARERGVDLAAVVGTGPEGRVIAEDVE
jgi:pyruvate dehydrogenase E2 component (dihydrolipoamide acetyltransferase)